MTLPFAQVSAEGRASRVRPTGPAMLALGALLAALAAASCATVQRDVLYESAPDAEPLELSAIEAELARNRAVPGAADPRALGRRLAALSAAPSSDSRRSARLLALEAEASLQSGDRGAASRLLERSGAAYGGDELAAVVASRLVGDLAGRRAALERALGLADEGARLRAELGSVLLAQGLYREALAAFDAALPRLGDDYRLLYGDERERAYALRDATAEAPGDVRARLGRQAIRLDEMAALAQAETNALDRITGGETWAAGILVERLKAAGWYLEAGAPGKAPATRKDAVAFLWALMARGDRRMAGRYSDRYAARATSPVPDVAYDAPYFDAVLGVVEEGVMPLADGRSFHPDEPASGLDFYGWLLAADAWR